MFSIIVPSYNRKEEIPALLESLEQQTIYHFEVIIVDDYSVEPVEIKKLYPFPVNIIRNLENKGAAESRNIGVQSAKNEWLLFLDDDDRFAYNKCEQLAKAIAENPACNFIYHAAKCEMINEGFSYTTSPFPPEKLTLETILMANKMGGMPMMCIKKSFYVELGGLDTNLKSLEDYEFALKLVSSPNLNAVLLNESLTVCAFHTQRSSVSTNTANTEKAIELIGQKYVKTEQQKHNFAINSLYMLAYPNAMNLSRKAASYYFKMFKLSHNLKHLVIAIVSFISPRLAINLKRFV